MADSFVLKAPEYVEPVPPGRRVALTGAAGRIGRSFTDYAGDRYSFRLLIHPEDDGDDLEDRGEVRRGDIRNAAFLQDAFDGMDTIVHLAADANPNASWSSLLPNNIIGTHQVFQVAVTCGVERVILASSIHAVSGYHPRHQVQPDDPVNPGDEYGVSKCFGEAMARYVSTQHGLTTICIRIGAFQPVEAAIDDDTFQFMHCFVSERDLNQLICRCIEDEKLQFAIFHGLSRNRFNRMDIRTAEELVGYAPQDDFTELNEHLEELQLNKRVQPHDESH